MHALRTRMNEEERKKKETRENKKETRGKYGSNI